MTDEPHADKVLRVAKAMARRVGFDWHEVPLRHSGAPDQAEYLAMAEAAIAELEKP